MRGSVDALVNSRIFKARSRRAHLKVGTVSEQPPQSVDDVHLSQTPLAKIGKHLQSNVLELKSEDAHYASIIVNFPRAKDDTVSQLRRTESHAGAGLQW